MINFGFIKSKKEMDAEMLNLDEEIVSQMAQSSTGFNNVNMATNSRKNMTADIQSKEVNAFNSGTNWGRVSAEEAAG